MKMISGGSSPLVQAIEMVRVHGHEGDGAVRVMTRLFDRFEQGAKPRELDASLSAVASIIRRADSAGITWGNQPHLFADAVTMATNVQTSLRMSLASGPRFEVVAAERLQHALQYLRVGSLPV